MLPSFVLSSSQPRLHVSGPFGSAAHTFASTHFQSLLPRAARGTNCLKSDTALHALSFQQLPTIKFRNPFFLITIQNAQGGYRPHLRRSESITLTDHPSRIRVLPALSEAEGSKRSESKNLSRALTPLFATDSRNRLLSPIIATLTKTSSRKSFVCHTYKTPRGVGDIEFRFSSFGPHGLSHGALPRCRLSVLAVSTGSVAAPKFDYWR